MAPKSPQTRTEAERRPDGFDVVCTGAPDREDR